jgi:hypothetical protein
MSYSQLTSITKKLAKCRAFPRSLCCGIPIVNFTNILQAAFFIRSLSCRLSLITVVLHVKIPKAQKIHSSCQSILHFRPSGSELLKAACRKLMKLTPGDSFTNILQAAFFLQKSVLQLILNNSSLAL